MRKRPVHVVWVDSTTIRGDGWTSVGPEAGLPTTDADLRHESVGYVVQQTDDVLILGHSRNTATGANHHSAVMGVVCIPTKAILSVRKL